MHDDCYTSLMRTADLISIDLAKITTFKTVLSELRLLDKQLGHSNLHQFVTFNKAYYTVTDAVQKAADDNYFKNPISVEKFTVCFALYYFQAINDTVSGASKLPVAWAKVNETTLTSTPGFISLLMGANAHINHDLPLALVKHMDRERTNDILLDVLKVDRLLMKSGRQIIGTFDESAKSLDIIKRRFQLLYYRPVMYMILYWRVIAWRNYNAIRRDGIKRDNHETRSVKIANRFLRLGSLIS